MKLADTKKALQAQIDELVFEFVTSGGIIQICRPAIADGSELGRLQRLAIRHG